MKTIYFSLLAEKKLGKITDYLVEHWSVKVKDDFLQTLKLKLKQISKNPENFPKSPVQSIFKCIVTKHNTLYFRISTTDDSIEIITIFDSRQHPDNLKRDLK